MWLNKLFGGSCAKAVIILKTFKSFRNFATTSPTSEQTVYIQKEEKILKTDYLTEKIGFVEYFYNMKYSKSIRF